MALDGGNDRFIVTRQAPSLGAATTPLIVAADGTIRATVDPVNALDLATKQYVDNKSVSASNTMDLFAIRSQNAASQHNPILQIDRVTTAASSYAGALQLRAGIGTSLATPGVMQNGTRLGAITFGGVKTANTWPLWYEYQAKIEANAEENFTGSAQGTWLSLWATKTGQSNPTEVMRCHGGYIECFGDIKTAARQITVLASNSSGTGVTPPTNAEAIPLDATSAVTVSLPAINGTTGGRIYRFVIQTGTSTVTITGQSGQNFLGLGTSYVMQGVGTHATFMSVWLSPSTYYWVVLSSNQMIDDRVQATVTGAATTATQIGGDIPIALAAGKAIRVRVDGEVVRSAASTDWTFTAQIGTSAIHNAQGVGAFTGAVTWFYDVVLQYLTATTVRVTSRWWKAEPTPNSGDVRGGGTATTQLVEGTITVADATQPLRLFSTFAVANAGNTAMRNRVLVTAN